MVIEYGVHSPHPVHILPRPRSSRVKSSKRFTGNSWMPWFPSPVGPRADRTAGCQVSNRSFLFNSFTWGTTSAWQTRIVAYCSLLRESTKP